MAKYCVIACHVLKNELDYFAAKAKSKPDIVYLEQGLHSTPDKLRAELQVAIDNVKDGYDAILVGYGLCSNGIENIKSRKIKLVVVRGHDCITHLLGSKERYREYFDKHPGTYWYSPGWIQDSIQPGKERYEKILKEYVEKYGEDNAKYLMEMEQKWFTEYSNAAYVDLGFGDNEKHKEYTKECAKWLKWNYDELSGDPKLLIDFLNGEWDEKRFLVVDPGHKIAASFNADIIRSQISAD